MIRRILTLMWYLFYRLFNTLAGVGYILLAILFYWLTFRTRAPEADYFTLVIGFFGALITFLLTLSLAARANEAQSYPILVRLQSRVEYLTAVFLGAVTLGLIFQMGLAVVAIVRTRPDLSLGRVADIPPLWLSVNILASTLALHATDFVTRKWSRVWVYGILAAFLIASDWSDTIVGWMSAQVRRASVWAYSRGSTPNGQFFQQAADWLDGTGVTAFENFFGFLFWPLQTLIDAVLAGFFTRIQALAPAIILIYATILFLLAADFFATKDLFLAEEQQ